MHKDFGQIHDVNNPPEKDSHRSRSSRRSRKGRRKWHKVVENNYGCLQNVVRKQLYSSSSGRGADSDDEEIREGIDEEEEEEENPLPAIQASRTGWVMMKRRAGQSRNRCTRT
jgi:hypothetical protein